MAVEPEPIPLVRDQAGRLMVPGTRISLADAYAIFTYYLRHREEVDACIAQQEHQGAEVRERLEAIWPPEEGLREKLVTRLES